MLKSKSLRIQILLFIVTFITTTISGAEWTHGKFLFFGEQPLTWSELMTGLYFSVPFLGILTVHEMGHYLTARWYNIKVTLPFYIPMWLGSIMPTIGTMGAFIRIKERINSRKQVFDVGVAGPIAGFVVAIALIHYGFTNLPDQSYLMDIHPEYMEYGERYIDSARANNEMSIALGHNLIFSFYETYVVEDKSRIPSHYEMYHYPFLFAGFLALFFTALNLIPIGQLDGGHVLYGLLGYEKSKVVFKILFLTFVFFAGLGVVNPEAPLEDTLISAILYLGFLFFTFMRLEPDITKRILLAIWIFILQYGIASWLSLDGQYGFYLVFAFVIGRILGVYHPPSLEEQPLDMNRKIIGWLALIIFILSFSPQPFIVEIHFSNLTL
jgi:membrane-associated protease RseP (regulator of RpoE activity)